MPASQLPLTKIRIIALRDNAMTAQTLILLLAPFFLIINIYTIIIGRRGSTRTHRIASISGVVALVALGAFVAALIDLLSQVWVMRPGQTMTIIYVTSGCAFAVFSLIALAMCLRLRSGTSADR